MRPKPDAKRQHWSLKVINVPRFEKELSHSVQNVPFAYLSRQTKGIHSPNIWGPLNGMNFIIQVSAWNAYESYYAPSYNRINVLQEHRRWQ